MRKNPILNWATANKAYIVTLDADFGSIIARNGATGPSVIRIRIEGLRGPELAKTIEMIALNPIPSLQSGAFITVSAGRIAVRLLPVIKAL